MAAAIVAMPTTMGIVGPTVSATRPARRDVAACGRTVGRKRSPASSGDRPKLTWKNVMANTARAITTNWLHSPTVLATST